MAKKAKKIAPGLKRKLSKKLKRSKGKKEGEFKNR